jgi:hypothetical protein
MDAINTALLSLEKNGGWNWAMVIAGISGLTYWISGGNSCHIRATS